MFAYKILGSILGKSILKKFGCSKLPVPAEYGTYGHDSYKGCPVSGFSTGENIGFWAIRPVEKYRPNRTCWYFYACQCIFITTALSNF